MTRPVEAACAAVIAAALFASAPAKAQFAGIDENQMQQVAPMLEMMKQQMGKQRFAQLMKTMGPMMEKVQGQGGLGGMASLDMGQMMSALGSMKGLLGNGNSSSHRRHARAKARPPAFLGTLIPPRRRICQKCHVLPPLPGRCHKRAPIYA